MVRRAKNKFIISKIIGLFLIIISLMALIIYLNYQNRKIIKTEESIKVYISNTSKNIVPPKKDISNVYDYIAILEIPDIKLKRGLVSSTSKYNSVKYNIEIISKSSMPDIINSNLILASHSGNSEVSFFSDLEKLKKDAFIYLYYNGYKYIYKLDYSYETEKTGEINITRNRLVNTITLITCKDNSNDIQVVYIAYLVGKIEYWYVLSWKKSLSLLKLNK